MKTLMGLVAFVSSSVFLCAQAPPPASPASRPQGLQVESMTPRQQMEAERQKGILRAPARTRVSTNGEIVFTYSGFLKDLASTNQPFRMISLRQPLDPKKDGENISRDPATGRVMGLKLLSIDF
jgi:hypothetical protein